MNCQRNRAVRTLYVERLEERRLLTTYHVSSLADNSGTGTLRTAITSANNHTGKDEVIIDASLLAGGLPIGLASTITISDPVQIHSENGADLTLLPASGSTAQEAFLIQPDLNGIGQSFEIGDLNIQNFKYGIRISATGSLTANAERVIVDGNFFSNNERAIYFQTSVLPFDVRNNTIIGRGVIGGPGFTNVGIWIESSTTTANTFNPTIYNNTIGNEDVALYVNDANIPNMSITSNNFGQEGSGTNYPNWYGLHIVDGSTSTAPGTGTVDGGIISQNNFINNTIGAWVKSGDRLTFDHNLFQDNITSGLDLTDSALRNNVHDNTFQFNDSRAIRIGANLSDQSVFNRVENNFFRFATSSGIPIDLGSNGTVDQNDTNDGDSGPNDRLNHPEFVESAIVDEGARWRVPIRLDYLGNGQARIEFYKFDPSTNAYSFIRAETRQIGTVTSQYELEENFYFQRGTEINPGQYLAALLIEESTPSGTTVNNTSELFKTTNALSNGSALPHVVDVAIDNLTITNGNIASHNWARGAYLYSAIVPTGKQLAPINTAGANAIQVRFSEHVRRADGTPLNGTELTLYPTDRRTNPPVPYTPPIITSNGFNYDPASHVATWTFPSLPADKYRIDLSTLQVKDVDNNALDSEWTNNIGSPGTFDNFADDLAGRTFFSGDGIAGGPNNAFRFLFSLLPGDSNQDGIVTSADTTNVADVNGDGLKNNTDITQINTTYLNTFLPAQRRRGDFNDDENVDGNDYVVWRAQYGTSPTSPITNADANGDGTVDGADYLNFRLGDPTYGAWHNGVIGPTGGGASVPIVDFGNAPKVTNVTISGSTSTHAGYSFASHDGSGDQLVTVPIGGADTISITFSEDVNVTDQDLRFIGLSTANVPNRYSFSYDMSTMTATWRFTNVIANDSYYISLSDAVTDIDGNQLDGEWINPASSSTNNSGVSQFPSGDGHAGGSFRFVITLLAGDADLNGTVNFNDYQLLIVHYGMGPGMTFSNGDFDGDGSVTSADYSQLISNYGISRQSIWILADLNGDHVVNDADINILGDHLGVTDPEWADGDLNFDNVVDSADLDLAFAQYGLELNLLS